MVQDEPPAHMNARALVARPVARLVWRARPAPAAPTRAWAYSCARGVGVGRRVRLGGGQGGLGAEYVGVREGGAREGVVGVGVKAVVFHRRLALGFNARPFRFVVNACLVRCVSGGRLRLLVARSLNRDRSSAFLNFGGSWDKVTLLNPSFLFCPVTPNFIPGVGGQMYEGRQCRQNKTKARRFNVDRASLEPRNQTVSTEKNEKNATNAWVWNRTPESASVTSSELHVPDTTRAFFTYGIPGYINSNGGLDSQLVTESSQY
ncbi:hypothetical protein C8J57DRAFT_1245636 [Mycena rebaudengoi]|nr:hypothetical protein C8J57DRAFT_1245636 [Mycena rebaudengoi]